MASIAVLLVVGIFGVAVLNLALSGPSGPDGASGSIDPGRDAALIAAADDPTEAPSNAATSVPDQTVESDATVMPDAGPTDLSAVTPERTCVRQRCASRTNDRDCDR